MSHTECARHLIMMATGQSDPPSDPQLTWDQHGSNFQMGLTRRQSPNLGTWTSYIILPDAIATAFLGYSTIATCLDPITPAKAAVSHLSHSAQDDRARYEKEARGIKLCGEREREREMASMALQNQVPCHRTILRLSFKTAFFGIQEPAV